MAEITAVLSITLDGVIQAPGRPDEDTRGGFDQGGWGTRFSDEVMGREMGKGMGKPGAILLGRRTWEDFAGAWGPQGDENQYAASLNNGEKYVCSRTLTDASGWAHSTALTGDAAATVAQLKRDSDKDITVLGSAELVGSLHAAGLVDTWCLLIHPLVLGSGRRLFPNDGPPAELHLQSSVATTTGVIIATYRTNRAEHSGER